NKVAVPEGVAGTPPFWSLIPFCFHAALVFHLSYRPKKVISSAFFCILQFDFSCSLTADVEVHP
ncbi:MAG: hypothetical protein IKI13_08230, partial [Bacteroidales bacterium]|nr:hypothetical protein [Bacteroidales bacterium]